MNKRKIGAHGERLAAEYLSRRGMRILERNYKSRRGEVDLIGCQEGYLVFVEVKYRRSDANGDAAEAVDGRKQRRICRAADWYRYARGIGEETPVRYDVVAIRGESVRWLKNAFPHILS